ncbi:helix-turn-helix domain-containing protein [Streptomyces sp. NPDC091371]|uniref:helix-turn-helix domain-containing protein n=1 Tax=Streptomyces sp. NPDC091371 TaxID=3155303 RepID=UPI00341B3086
MTQSVETTSASDAERSLPTPKERRRLREAADLTHDEVAAAVGVTPTTVRSWETGRTAPRGRKREVYARFLTRLQAPAESPSAAAANTPAGLPGAHADTPAAPEAAMLRPADADADSPDAPASVLRAIEAVRAFVGAGAAVGNGTRPKAPAEPPAGAAPAEAPSLGAAAPDARPAPAGADASGSAGTPEPTPAAAPRADAAETDRRSAPAEAPGATGSVAPAAAEAPQVAAAPLPTAGSAPAAVPEADRPDQQPAEDPAEHPAEHPAEQPARQPAEDFDALHAHAAPALTRQTYLLTGRRALAQEAVERAFQQAWAHWPEVATDPDPVGWVRAAAYEYALSPWHQLRRAHRHPDKPPAEPADRVLLDAMLALPVNHRRTVLLYDGVGLDLPDTAAETEASTPTAGNRLLHAHATLAERIPELADVAPEKQSALLRDKFMALEPAVALDPRPAAVVRNSGERRTRLWTRAALGMTAVIAVATAYTAATAPTEYKPPNAPGANVSGVPPHSGPQRLTDESRALHDKLRSDPAAGPARIVPMGE